MTETVRAYMARHNMAAPGASILCACSGGADSMALLHLLPRLGEYRVFCAHFNHRLRGDESERDETFVRDWCAFAGIPFRAGGANVAAWAKERRLGTEEAARLLRYDFLERTADALGCGLIATAHNAEDNAETVLMRLLRGAGTRGLSGIPPVRGRLIRPMLSVSRAEILAYLNRWGVPHVEDGSNASEDYFRNRLRHRLLPLLEELNPGAVSHINAAAELLRADEAYLNARAEDFIRHNGRTDGSLSVPALLAEPEPLALRVLRNLCPGASREQLEDLYYGLCLGNKPHGSRTLPGRRAYRDRDLLYIVPAGTAGGEAAPHPPDPVELSESGKTSVPGTGKVLRRTKLIFTEEIHSSFNTFYFNYDNICDTILAGVRMPGDSLRLTGRGCTKTLKQLYTEAKLPLEERKRRIVLRDGAGVIAAEGFGVAERCAPVPGKPAVRVEIFSAAGTEREKFGE